LQNDAVSEMARSVLPLIATDLWWGAEPADEGARAALRRAALDRLADWNGEMSENLAEPLIFAAWMRALTRRLTADELGPLEREFEGARPLFVERVFRDVDGAARWCDVDKTARAESCPEIAALALDDALDELTRDYGGAIDAWRWGEAHVATQVHNPLGYVRALGWLFNIRNETSGGDYTVLRGAMRGSGPTPYANIHAGGFRAVVDFADPDGSTYIQSSGQSGHFLSRFYDNFAALWADGGYVPMSLDIEDARAGSVGSTFLRPR
jgi:penicillin amidase